MTTIPSPYYGGGQVPSPADVIRTAGAPSTKLIGLALGSLAVDDNAGVMYGLVSKSGGTADWVVLGGGALSGITTINGNTGSVTGTSVSLVGANSGAPLAFAGSGTVMTATITPGTYLVATLTGSTGGGAISPTAGNINLVAGPGITITGSGSSITFDATSAVGVQTLTGNTGGAISPSGGNINIIGANSGVPLAFAGSGSSITATITPGSSLVATLTGSTSGGAISPSSGNINLVAGPGITISGSGSSITFDATAAVGVQTLTGNTGGAISPSSGNINIVGAGGLTVAGSGSTLTIDGSAVSGVLYVAPNSGDAHVDPASDGGLSLLGTTNQITVTGTAASHEVTFSLPMHIVTPGDVTVSQILQVANGYDLFFPTAGSKITFSDLVDPACSIGRATFLSAGSVTVNCTSVTAASLIFLTPQGSAATTKTYCVGNIVAGATFEIFSSDASDTTVVNWWVIN